MTGAVLSPCACGRRRPWCWANACAVAPPSRRSAGDSLWPGYVCVSLSSSALSSIAACSHPFIRRRALCLLRSDIMWYSYEHMSIWRGLSFRTLESQTPQPGQRPTYFTLRPLSVQLASLFANLFAFAACPHAPARRFVQYARRSVFAVVGGAGPGRGAKEGRCACPCSCARPSCGCRCTCSCTCGVDRSIGVSNNYCSEARIFFCCCRSLSVTTVRSTAARPCHCKLLCRRSSAAKLLLTVFLSALQQFLQSISVH